jgi:hypothetical protein
MDKRIALRVSIVGVVLSLFGSAATATRIPPSGQAPDKQPIVFKAPSGYMPAEFSKHTGKLLLDPQRPAGMFVGYPSDGQDMAAFTDEVKDMVVKMFLHDSKNVTWNSSGLPPHKNIDTESGNLLTASDDKMEVQLAFYVRSDKGVAYGYFGMRHKKGKGDDAKFLDSSGAGVKAFDELARSIGDKPKN